MNIDVAARDLRELARVRLRPMVCGLFPRTEQEEVFRLLEKSVVILTPTNIEEVLVATRWDHTAWVLANLYLGSLGRQPFSPEEGGLVGISEETTCYLSLEYLRQNDPLEDYLVHEAAHVFHNCKRRELGLLEKRNQEWLLAIEFRKRETFAYACEAYGAIREHGTTVAERSRLLQLLSERRGPADERVDTDEFLDIVQEACRARNGWKRILARCASVRVKRPPGAIFSRQGTCAPYASRGATDE